MNHLNSSIRCPHCNLVNFATEAFCKRCKNSLQSNDFSANANSINININFPATMQPRINTQTNQQPYAQSTPYSQPKEARDNQSGYQLQNQDGFRQWQQENQHQNQHQNQPLMNHAPVNVPFYPPPSGFPLMNYGNTVWRRGSEIVVHRYNGTLPDACVKCGESISGYSNGAFVSQKYRWHNPLVYIAIISPLIYCILAAVLSHRVKIEVPLCGKHIEARKATGKMLFSSGVGAFLAIIFFGSFGYIGFSFLIFLAAIIGIILGYEYSYKPLQVSKIENDYVYLKNADNNYLNRLPHC